MNRCLLWGTGKWFKENIQMIRFMNDTNLIEVVGVTSNDERYNTIMGFKFIKKEFVDPKRIDYLISMVSDILYFEIVKEAISMGFDESRIVPIKVINMPGFDFDKYRKIKEIIQLL